MPSPAIERSGDASFKVWPYSKSETLPIAEIKVPVGEKIRVGDHQLSVKEIRYWVGMDVRYDPGQPVVLASLWVALGGMIITFIGRMQRYNA
jgi:hypothetical protein